MADPSTIDWLNLPVAPGYFWGNNPNVNQQLRQRIALQMMQRQRPYPKTFGEGLASIGDSISDAATARMLMQQDLAAQQEGAAAKARIFPPVTGAGGAAAAATPVPQQASDTAGFRAANASADMPDQTPDQATDDGRNAIVSAALARWGIGGGAPANPPVAPEIPPGPAQPTGPQPSGGPIPDQRIAQATTIPTASTTDITPAPAVPSQIRTAPPTVLPPPIQMQRPTLPTPVDMVAPSRLEMRIIDEINAGEARGNPYVRMQLQPYLDQIQATRAFQQSQRKQQYDALMEDYKQKNAAYLQWLAQTDTREVARAKAPSEIEKATAEAAKAQAEANAGLVPTTRDIYGTGQLLQFDPKTQTWITPPSATPRDPNVMPQVKLTEDQRKSMEYHDWAKLGDAAVRGNEALFAKGWAQEVIGKYPDFGGNKLLNAQYRAAKQGADAFIQAFMRSTSGAQYGPVEAEQHARAMLPKFGDDPKTLAQKAEQRQAFIDSLYAGAGPGQQIIDFNARKRDEARAAADARINDEMKDTPKVEGKIYKNPANPQQRRRWTGQRWEDVQ